MTGHAAGICVDGAGQELAAFGEVERCVGRLPVLLNCVVDVAGELEQVCSQSGDATVLASCVAPLIR